MNTNNRKWWIIGGIAGAILLCLCVAGIGMALAGNSLFRQVQQVATEVVLPVDTETPVSAATATVAGQTDGPTGEAAPDLAADAFLEHLANNRYAEAVAMTTIDLRSDSTTEATLQDIVENKELEPSAWEWTNQTTSDDGTEVYYEGTMTFANGTTGPVEVQVRQEDNVWRVFYMDLKTEGAAAPSGSWNTWTEAQKEEQIAVAQGSADAFIMLWQSGEYDAAYELTTQEMKNALGGAAGLTDFFNGVGASPESWEWDNSELIDIGADYPVIQLTGQGVFTADQRAPLEIQLEWENDMWLVRYININPE